jgi:hypothetical protein
MTDASTDSVMEISEIVATTTSALRTAVSNRLVATTSTTIYPATMARLVPSPTDAVEVYVNLEIQ